MRWYVRSAFLALSLCVVSCSTPSHQAPPVVAGGGFGPAYCEPYGGTLSEIASRIFAANAPPKAAVITNCKGLRRDAKSYDEACLIQIASSQFESLYATDSYSELPLANAPRIVTQLAQDNGVELSWRYRPTEVRRQWLFADSSRENVVVYSVHYLKCYELEQVTMSPPSANENFVAKRLDLAHSIGSALP